MPVSRSATMSGMPPIRDAMTGLPAAIASIATVGHRSKQIDGTMPAMLCRQAVITAACGQFVCTTTLGGNFVGLVGRMPPIATSGGAELNPEYASNSVSIPFGGISEPTKSR